MKKESTIFMMNGKIVNCRRRIKKKQLEINQDTVVQMVEDLNAKVHFANQYGLSSLQKL